MHINGYINEQCISDFLHTYTPDKQVQLIHYLVAKQQKKKLLMPMPFMILSVCSSIWLSVQQSMHLRLCTVLWSQRSALESSCKNSYCIACVSVLFMLCVSVFNTTYWRLSSWHYLGAFVCCINYTENLKTQTVQKLSLYEQVAE